VTLRDFISTDPKHYWTIYYGTNNEYLFSIQSKMAVGADAALVAG
jgi:hypothetical protein